MEKKFVTTTYHLKKEMKNEPQEVRLRFVFVSDLHNVSLGEKNGRLLSAIRGLCPDAVLIGGDMLVARPGMPFDAAADFIRRVSAEFPVYYANGNHEYRLKLYPETYGDMYQRFREVIARTDIVYLENETAEVRMRGVPVAIHGYEADKRYYNRLKKTEMPVSELERLFGTPDEKRYHILLAHNPFYRRTYLEWGADLTLSGHCHGGVVGLGKHRGLISPNLRLFSDCCRGRFERNGKSVIVSAGLGEHTIPVRLHNPRELVFIEVTLGAGVCEKNKKRKETRWESR